MTTHPRHDGPRYATLRDYLLVIRARWLVIVAVAAIFTAGAVALALRQKTTYTSSASIEFSDPTANESELLGLAPSTSTFVPAQQATDAASTLYQRPMLSQVRKNLGLKANQKLPGSASGYVNPTNSYLIIQGEGPNATTAATIANAFANAQVTVSENTARAQFRQLAQVAQHELQALTVNDLGAREVYEDRQVRLNYLAQTASPARVLEPAVLPSGPSSPHPVTDAALGLLVGITLGLVIAFILDSLDRRLKRGNEISEELGWPILGHIREGALGGVAFGENGAGEGGEKPSINGLDREAFHILRRNLQLINLDEAPRSIIVTSAMPEEGKSTVAASLACASALAGKLTLLVDCDLRRPAIAPRLGLKPEPGLVDFLLGEATPREIVQTVAIPGAEAISPNGSNAQASVGALPGPAGVRLACITAGKSCPSPAELFASDRFHKFLAEIKQAYEMVVLDSAPVLAVADPLELVTDVDATLVCLRATKTTRDEASALKTQLGRIPEKQIGLVVTGVPFGATREFGYYSYAYGYS